MSMRFDLEKLRPAMRAQAEAQLAPKRDRANEAGQIVREQAKKVGRLNRRPQLPRLSVPEERLALHLRAEGLSGFEREHRFCTKRFWRFDFAWFAPKLAVEVNGGIHSQGRHTRGTGYQLDRDKVNEAVILGWRVLEFTPRDVKSGKAVRQIKRALDAFRT
jgi:very-short-patch-repair endonuclease